MSYFEHEALLGEPIGISKNSITFNRGIFLFSHHPKFLGVSDETSVILLLLLKCGFHAYLPT